jgi:hypothetical protein
VRKGALVMAGSVLLYGIVQVPAFMGFPESPQVRAPGLNGRDAGRGRC